jgi:hypothetical protein
MKKVSEQISTVGGVLAFLFILVVTLSPPAVLAGQQTTSNTTTTTTTTAVGIISEIMDLPQQLVVDNEPLYQSTGGDLTSMRVVDIISPSVVIEEGSFVEKAIMKNIGNVTNTETYVENIDYGEGIVRGVGKGIITTENRGDMISWNAYDIGLLSGYGSDNDNVTTADNETATAGGLNTDRITTYRGIIFFSTDSERLSFMNNLVGLYISQINEENGTSLRQIWEWRNNY